MHRVCGAFLLANAEFESSLQQKKTTEAFASVFFFIEVAGL